MSLPPVFVNKTHKMLPHIGTQWMVDPRRING